MYFVNLKCLCLKVAPLKAGRAGPCVVVKNLTNNIQIILTKQTVIGLAIMQFVFVIAHDLSVSEI